MFGSAVFKAIEVKVGSRLNFEALQPQNFLTWSESLAANLKKVRHDKRFKSSDLFDIDIFLFALLTRVSL